MSPQTLVSADLDLSILHASTLDATSAGPGPTSVSASIPPSVQTLDPSQSFHSMKAARRGYVRRTRARFPGRISEDSAVHPIRMTILLRSSSALHDPRTFRRRVVSRMHQRDTNRRSANQPQQSIRRALFVLTGLSSAGSRRVRHPQLLHPRLALKRRPRLALRSVQE